jgi:shikimate dehydrogenase
MRGPVTAATTVAAVIGDPVAHSLSPVLHNAWIEAAGLDAVYVALRPPGDFPGLVQALRGAVVRGLNVTAPYKALALTAADSASEQALRAGAANLLLFEPDGSVWADNTDGEGLLAAFAEQAPGFDPRAGPAVIVGAGGAARGAIAAFLDAGAPAVRIVNRSPERAHGLAAEFGSVVSVGDALADANVVINATPAAPEIAFGKAPASAVAMDMTYRPLATPFLLAAGARGLKTVDGLAMLIGQARPSFTALFGVRPPVDVDVRAEALRALSEQGRQG